MLEDFRRHEKAQGEGKIGDHFSNLYDQDEDAAGQRIDEATGRPIDNSSSGGGADEHLSIVESGGRNEDALGALPEEDDEAARWLRDAEAKGNA